jgi:hypothetical protein
MPEPMPIQEDDFNKNTQYSQDTVGALLEVMKLRAPEGTVLLNYNEHSAINAPAMTTNRDGEIAVAIGNVNNDTKHVAGIFLVGTAEKKESVPDYGFQEGSHYIAAVYNNNKNSLTIIDPYGKDKEISTVVKWSHEQIIKEFKDKFPSLNHGTIAINPPGKVVYQGESQGADAVSCGATCVHNLENFLHEKDPKEDEKLGITKINNQFRCENGAEKLRASQKQQIEKYNEDNMSKNNGSELDEEEIRSTTSSTTRYGTQDDEEAKKRRTSRTHPAPGDEQQAENSIGSSEAITKLWNKREHDLKTILKEGGYDTNDMSSNEKGVNEVIDLTADELIKHYNILTNEREEAGKARAAIYKYNQKFSTELAEAMSAAVKERKGDKLDFSKPTIKIDTGNGKTIELDVRANPPSKLKQITIPEKFADDANFTMSIAFQDEHGRNMPKNGALYYQIRVENGKITSTNAPELKQDENGQYYAEGPKGPVYPKLDRETLERMQKIKVERAEDNVVAHNTNYAPLTKENRAKLPDENNKQKRSSRDSDSDTSSIASESGESEQARPATAPTPGQDLRQTLQTPPAQKTPGVDGAFIGQRGLNLGLNKKQDAFTPIPGGFPGVKAVAQNTASKFPKGNGKKGPGIG